MKHRKLLLGVTRRGTGKGCALLAALLLLSLTPSSGQAATGVLLSDNELAVADGFTCGYIDGGWIVGSLLKNRRFLSLAQQLKDVRKSLRKPGLSPSKKKSLKKKAATLKARLAAGSAACGQLAQPTPTPTATPTPIATPLPNATTIAWTDTAFANRLNVGGEYLYFCPSNAGDITAPLFGTDIYTSDSTICTAAVHAGLFEAASGGNVKIKMGTGLPLFYGSVRNGVTSSFYGISDTSFDFLDLNTNTEIVRPGPFVITGTQHAVVFRGMLDQTFSFICPVNVDVTSRSIYGTDVYTDDSPICIAAIHAGRIARASGGTVTIKIQGNNVSYAGSTQNGVTSQSYGAFSNSYIFVP